MSILERLKDDIVYLRGALRALKMTTPIAKNPTRVFPVVIDELAEKYGDAPALISDRERFSYRALAERSNRYARWALRENLAKGETVCLLMPNRPEYMAVWIGITSVGGVVALINTNLIGPSLAHCIDIVAPQAHHRRRRAGRRLRDRAAAAQEQGARSGRTARAPNFRASTARSTPCPATGWRPPSAPR